MWKPEYLLIGGALLLVLAFVQYRSLSGDLQWGSPLRVAREKPPAAGACDEHALGEVDYKVYRALLPKEQTDSDLMPNIILVTNTEAYSEDYQKVEDLVGQGWTSSMSAVANFTKLSSDLSPLERDKFQDLPLVLATNAEIDKVFANGTYQGWMALGHVPIVRFSRIGFNCERDQAIVHKSYSCGGECGTDTLYLMEKTGDDWVVLNQLVVRKS